MTFAGINGERAEAIKKVLRQSSQRMVAYEIVESIRATNGEELLRTSGNVEAIQAVLRALERRGEVDRKRMRAAAAWPLEDHWGLV